MTTTLSLVIASLSLATSGWTTWTLHKVRRAQKREDAQR